MTVKEDSHQALGEVTLEVAGLLRELGQYPEEKTIILELYGLQDLLNSLEKLQSI